LQETFILLNIFVNPGRVLFSFQVDKADAGTGTNRYPMKRDPRESACRM